MAPSAGHAERFTQSCAEASCSLGLLLLTEARGRITLQVSQLIWNSGVKDRRCGKYGNNDFIHFHFPKPGLITLGALRLSVRTSLHQSVRLSVPVVSVRQSVSLGCVSEGGAALIAEENMAADVRDMCVCVCVRWLFLITNTRTQTHTADVRDGSFSSLPRRLALNRSPHGSRPRHKQCH